MRIFSRDHEELYLFYFSTDDTLLSDLVDSITWNHNRIKVFGKEYLEPRLTAWFGPPYKYSNIQWPEKQLPECLFGLKKTVEEFADTQFNSVLLNYYRDGKDSMGWHSDNEPEMDQSIIASVSLGATRTIRFRNKVTKETANVELKNGSVLLMKNFQENWQHAIPKREKITEPRLNLTFRKIIA